MKYVIMLAILLTCCIGCAKDYCPRVPRPAVPEMKPVSIEKGVIKGVNLDNVIENMLNLQRMVDELGICPCWEDNK